MHVTEHNIRLNTNIVDEEKLRITMELMESQVDGRVKAQFEHFEAKIKPKIKKRLKLTDYE